MRQGFSGGSTTPGSNRSPSPTSRPRPPNILIIWGDDIAISKLSRTLDCGKLLNDFESPMDTLKFEQTSSSPEV